MGLELAKAWIRIRADSSRLRPDLDKVRKQATGRMGMIAGQMGGMLKGAAIAAAAMAIRQFGMVGEDFNRKMRQSLAIMGDVSQVMRKDMKEAAFAAARATQFSAGQAAESFFFLASAGLDAKQSVAALPQVALFAQAGMFDMARATDLATDAQSALGLTVKDAQQNLTNLKRVTDVLVKANTLANASVEQFSMALTTKAGAALKIVGKSIEEGVAVLAAFADQGLKASQAGTALNIVFRDLQTKALKNKAAFEEAGVAVFDSAGKMRNMADIIGDLENRLAGMSAEGKKTTLMQLGFADKSLIFLQTLLGTSEKIREYEKELRKAGGTTKEVADKQLTPFQKGWAKMTASVTKASAALMKFAGPVLGTLMKGFGGLLTIMERNRVLLGFVGGTMLVLAAGVKMVTVATWLMVTSMKALSAVMTFVSKNPLVAVLVGLATAVGLVAQAFARDAKARKSHTDQVKMQIEADKKQENQNSDRLNSLVLLTKKQKLNTDEMADAVRLSKSLKREISGLGIVFEGNTVKIKDLTKAQKLMNEQMRETAIERQRQLLAAAKQDYVEFKAFVFTLLNQPSVEFMPVFEALEDNITKAREDLDLLLNPPKPKKDILGEDLSKALKDGKITLEMGRFGIGDLGRQIQEVFLRRHDPQAKMVELLTAGNELMKTELIPAVKGQDVKARAG